MRPGALLHDPYAERDACGIGFVADPTGRASREVVDLLLAGLTNVRHRGATAADRLTGDGAGVLLPIPEALRPEPGCGLAMVFLRDEGARDGIAEACAAEGLVPAGWRPVPVAPAALGGEARACLPTIEQLVLLRPVGLDDDELELRAYRARRRTEAVAGAYVASLSFRTVTYKALCAADHLADFYADLRDPAVAVPFGIFHQRFSTNTGPTWERAQPFRLLCHNGEINAVRGNVNWMRARAGHLGFGRPPPGRVAAGRVGLGLGHPRQRARGGRPRRPRRAPCDRDADPRVVGAEPRDAGGDPRLLPLPRGARRAVGRARRHRLHGRARRRCHPRSQRAAAAALRRRRRRPGRLRLRGGRRPAPGRRPHLPREARPEPDAHGRSRPRRGGGAGDQAPARPPAPLRAVAGRGDSRRRAG